MKSGYPYFRAWISQPRNRTLILALAFMAIIIAFVELRPAADTDRLRPESVDTYIPAGYVLVPIELQNADSLSSLIGAYAVVDLFVGSPALRRQKVGARLKLLRAPLNPQQFAVLVPEEQVSNLLSTPGPYWAAIQNPVQNKATEFARKKSLNVEYF